MLPGRKDPDSRGLPQMIGRRTSPQTKGTFWPVLAKDKFDNSLRQRSYQACFENPLKVRGAVSAGCSSSGCIDIGEEKAGDEKELALWKPLNASLRSILSLPV